MKESASKNRLFYHNIIKQNLNKYILVTTIETITYTASFSLSGLFKRDVFNILENKPQLFRLSLPILIALIAAVPIIINIVKQLNAYWVNAINMDFQNNVKLFFYKHLSNIEPEAEIRKNIESGDMMSRFRDSSDEIVNYIMEFYYQLPKLFLSIVALIVMFRINWEYTLICVVPVLLVLILLRRLRDKISMYRKKTLELSSQTSSYLGNIFDSMTVIKLASIKAFFIKKYDKILNLRKRVAVKDGILNNILNEFSSNIMSLAMGTILLLMYNRFYSEGFTVGDFVLFEYYFWFLAYLPSSISRLGLRMRQASTAKDRIDLNSSIENENLLSADKSINDVNNEIFGFAHKWTKMKIIFKRSPIESLTLQQKVIDLEPGDIIFIQGSMGSGKSTFLKSLFDYYGKKNVEVLWTDRNGEQQKTDRLYPPIATYVSQSPLLFNGSLRDNICLGKKYDSDLMKRVLYKSCLDIDVSEFEKGLDTDAGSNGRKMSGGQKKRIALARALYQEGQILVVDDLLTGLDIATQMKIKKRLLKDHNLTFILTGGIPIDDIDTNSKIIYL